MEQVIDLVSPRTLVTGLLLVLAGCSYSTVETSREERARLEPADAIPAVDPVEETCETVSCPSGFRSVDGDGDRCNERCVTLGCVLPICAAGTFPFDSKLSGCPDQCAPIVCTHVVCPNGMRGADVDGDGCYDRCNDSKACAPVDLDCGLREAIDFDDDGCLDMCAFAACRLDPKMLPACSVVGPSHFVDTTGDGACDVCVPDSCAASPTCDGARGTDLNGDRCPDTCP